MNLFKRFFCTHFYGEEKDDLGYRVTPWLRLKCQKCGHTVYIDRFSLR